MTVETHSEERIPFYRDERVLQFLTQAIVFLVVIGFVIALFVNMNSELETLGIPLSMEYLQKTAGFDIGETLIEYSRASRYLDSYYVGVLNTLRVAIIGIAITTVLGVVVGISRLSTNWLLSRIAMAYIEVLRNIPLLVLLIFWYQGVFLNFPPVKEAITRGSFFFSKRGIVIPWGLPTESFGAYRIVLLFGLIAAIAVYIILTQQGKKTGRMPLVSVWSSLTLIVIAIIGWFIVPANPLSLDLPVFLDGAFNITGGYTLTSEFLAVLSGLVIYTSAFIAEIVRAGIQSVSKGQVEASRAIGLNQFQTLRLVVFPQALRVMVPPMTSQYLNLTKNSSLAVAVGYPDLFGITGTIMNQSGRSVEAIGLMMVTYLSFSLITSLFMNIYNKRIKLVER